MALLCERRLRRPLTELERRTLSTRIARLGSARLGDVVLDSSPTTLAAWLADEDAV